MRHAILFAGLTLALAGCQSTSNQQYGLVGNVSEDRRAQEYSITNDNGSRMDDMDRCEEVEKSAESAEDGD